MQTLFYIHLLDLHLGRHRHIGWTLWHWELSSHQGTTLYCTRLTHVIQVVFTYLPLRSHPVPVKDRREIAIARIQGNHFVQVFLRPHYPVPPTPVWWQQHVSIKARGWVDSYIVRMNLWSEIMGGGPGAPGGEFGGDID
ncbi:hypothetical protein Acr_24g0008240 [Actinidia rufa]|uniref:Uncharacterized protein n=1 Tax=Actinidia rufa TaxID=165716 RepID=A0A7J0GVV2_9ERIC|nr:hypothetical protein Acr_24g0008240 [Actinidia rufa]